MRIAGGQESDRELDNLCWGVPPEQFRHESLRLREPHLAELRVEDFDAGFFGYSPAVASRMDPQHRVFMEVVWEALESAGCPPDRNSGAIGVFAGAGFNHYLLSNVLESLEPTYSLEWLQTLLGNDKDYLASRVSYKLNLRGPSISVQTACSTSLVAVHLACQSLLAGECDIALAGGVSVRVPQRAGYLYEEGGIQSPEAR